MRHLAFSERSTLTVADQADTDGVLIVIWASLAHDMGTGQLMIPTVSRMDFTIGKAISIAEDEVVSQSLVAEAQMLAMDRFRCPERLAKMVDHDARPTVSIQLHGQIKDGITAVCDLIEFRQIGQREALVGIERPSRLSRPMASVIATAKLAQTIWVRRAIAGFSRVVE